MALDILVRTLFTDNGLSAGLAKANNQLNQIARSGPGARAGLRAVETGARQLAFSAAGLPGAMGNIARGMLQISGGNALVLGAVAGLGLVAGAYALITKGARDAIKEQDDFVASLRQLGPHAAAAAERIKLAGLQGRVGARQSLKEVGEQFLADMTGGLLGRSGTEQRESLQRQIATQTIAVATAERAATAAANERQKALRKLADEIARQNELERQQIVIKGKLLGLARMDAIQLLISTDRARAKSTALERAMPFGFFDKRPTDDVKGMLERRMGGGIDRLELAQMAMMSLMMGARGGASGAFGAAGGLLSGISTLKGVGAGLAGPLGWAGFGLSALGGVFGLFNNDEERRHKELIQAMRDLRPIIEQARVSRVIVSATGDFIAQTEYEIGRREDRDATDRDGRSI